MYTATLPVNRNAKLSDTEVFHTMVELVQVLLFENDKIGSVLSIVNSKLSQSLNHQA